MILRKGRRVAKKSGVLARIRKICLALPETSERLSHGAPTLFIRGKRSFVTFQDNHHRDGRLALWCASSVEIRGMLVKAAPRHYFVPPYVGYLGWIGVNLDQGLGWDQIAGMIEDAYLTAAPKKLIEAVKIGRPE